MGIRNLIRETRALMASGIVSNRRKQFYLGPNQSYKAGSKEAADLRQLLCHRNVVDTVTERGREWIIMNMKVTESQFQGMNK